MAVTSFGTPAMTRATSGSVTGTWGTGQNRTAGHLLVAMVSAGGSTASAAAISTPAGWTQILVESNVATTANAWVAAYYKVAAGSDSAPAFTATLTGTVAMTVTLLELAAANDLNPADTTGVYGSGGSSGTLSAMTVTSAANVSASGEYAVTCYCQEAAAATNTWNGGGSWTNAANDGSTSSVLHTAVDYQANPAQGSTATETGHWTTNTSAFGAAVIVVFGAQSGGLELYTNDATTSITSGGGTTPVSGTAELWTAATWSGFPVASPTTTPPTKFHIADPNAASELIQVVNTSTGLVVRGSEGTTPVAHSSGFTVRNVISAGAGAGAWPQTYNVRAIQFGAKGDGSTDDTGAIQNAINAANTAGGGPVYFPAGTYKISSALTLYNNITLAGDGRAVTIIKQVTTTAHGLYWTGQNLQYVTVRDLQIQGPGSGSGIGINLNNTGTGGNPNILGVHIENVYIYGFGGDGFAAEILIVSQFDNVIVSTCGGDGFSLSGGVNTSVVMNACWAISCTDSGFDLENLNYCTLNSCVSQSCATGFYLYSGEGVTLNSCGDQGSINSFEVYGGTGITQVTCYTYKNAGISFWVTDSADNVTLIGCQEQTPNGATNSFRFDAGCDVNVIGWQFTTAALQTSTPNQLNDGSGNFQVSGACYLDGAVNAYALASFYGGTDTSVTAAATSPSFTSGTALQLSTTQDVMLYIAIQTAAALAVAIGAANTTTTSLMPSKTYALGLISIRVPKGWYVKITGTIADLTIAQVTC